MTKKVRVEIRFDEEKDKDMIDFIDKYGSTRAGFIKQVLRLYKAKIEGSGSDSDNIAPIHEPKETRSTDDKRKNKKKKISAENDIAFSSKDFQ